jgi:hypothetical protein
MLQRAERRQAAIVNLRPLEVQAPQARQVAQVAQARVGERGATAQVEVGEVWQRAQVG